MRIEQLPHVSPAAGCACVACDASRLAHLNALSATQRYALAALHPKIPRHVDDIRGRCIHHRTVASLMVGDRRRPALVQQLDLRRPLLDAPYYAFLLLTRHGADAVAARRRAGLSL